MINKDFSFQVNTFTSFNSSLHLSVYQNILFNHLFRIKNLCSSCYKVPNIERLMNDTIIHGYTKHHLFIQLSTNKFI